MNNTINIKKITYRKVEEASVLRQCAHAAQQEAATLLADKQELLEAIRILQVLCCLFLSLVE